MSELTRNAKFLAQQVIFVNAESELGVTGCRAFVITKTKRLRRKS